MIETFLNLFELEALWLSIIGALPRILFALLILVGGWLIAKLVQAVTRRLLARTGLDAAVERSNLGAALQSAEYSVQPSRILGLFFFWLIFLSALLLALEKLQLTAILILMQRLIGYLPKVLASGLILVGGSLLAQFVGRLTHTAAESSGVEFADSLGKISRWVILILTIFVALEQLGLDVSLLADSLVWVIIIIVASLGASFALGGHQIPHNALAGFYARERFECGDILVVDDFEGELIGIGSINSELRSGSDRLVVPNARLLEAVIRVRQAYGAESDD